MEKIPRSELEYVVLESELGNLCYYVTLRRRGASAIRLLELQTPTRVHSLAKYLADALRLPIAESAPPDALEELRKKIVDGLTVPLYQDIDLSLISKESLRVEVGRLSSELESEGFEIMGTLGQIAKGSSGADGSWGIHLLTREGQWAEITWTSLDIAPLDQSLGQYPLPHGQGRP